MSGGPTRETGGGASLETSGIGISKPDGCMSTKDILREELSSSYRLSVMLVSGSHEGNPMSSSELDC